MADVTISYNNSNIVEMDDSGTEVLDTNGKYMNSDITIEYNKPDIPEPRLQAKTNISPTTVSQTITPDLGYDGLSRVQINAISPTKSAQIYTPATSDQTIAAGRWLTGAQTIKGDANLVPANIKKDVSIFGVVGNYEGSGGSAVINPLNVNSNGTYTPPSGVDGYSPVIVNVSGGGSATIVEPKDVNFIDYNGLIVYSYTADEFAELSAMPNNPAHSGLTAQGWNWTLADAKAYVADYGKLWIGQMYITDDGKTRIYIHLDEGRLSPLLGLGVNGTVDVDWGDGTAHTTLTGTSLTTIKWTTRHNYQIAGDYVIKLTVTNGSMSLIGQSGNAGSGLLRYSQSTDSRNYIYRNSVKKVEIGNNITNIGVSAFAYCYSLSSITMPNNLTSIGSTAFAYCYSLSGITIPSSVTSISDYVFCYCYSLSSVTIPNGVTSIRSNTFAYCYSLSSVTIPSSVTSIESIAFYYCYSLSSVTIPSSVTSMGNYVFYYCYSLSSVTIPSNVTSIGNYVFYYCYGLSSATIPSNITSIGESAFSHCSCLGFIKFNSTTPPISNSNAFSTLSADCIIYVPSGSLSAYTSAANYPNSSTYTYVEY